MTLPQDGSTTQSAEPKTPFPLLALACLPLSIIHQVWAWGVVLSITWGWFVVPAFPVAPLTHGQALAVSVLTTLLGARIWKFDPARDHQELWRKLLCYTQQPWFTLGSCWVAKVALT